MMAGSFNNLHTTPALIVALGGTVGFFISMIYIGWTLVKQSDDIEHLKRALESPKR